MFEKKQNAKDFNWKTVEYVQSCVKDTVGIGKQLTIHFFAPLNETTPETVLTEVCYDYK
jgi:hypothetical protein